MATEESKVRECRAVTATSGGGSAGRGEREGADSSLPPELLKKNFIFTVKDAQPQLLKDCRVSNKDRQKKQLVCAACKKHISHIKTVKSHIETKEHKIKLKEHELEMFLPALHREYPAESLQTLTDFLTETFQDHSAREQRETRFSVATELQGYLHEDGLDVTVSVFGSSASGFALKSSNVNLNINFSTPTDNPLVIARSMKGVAECLRNRGESYEDVEEDYFSFNRIPRILFQHKHSKLKCELRIEAGNPAALCSLLKLYAEVDVRCVQLAVLFRLWARICGLDSQEGGHYPGHMFVLMVIYFLQQVNVLPILHELYKNKTSKYKKSSAESGSGPTSPETKAPTTQHSRKPGDEDSSGGTDQEGVGEGEEDDDDIVVFKESETGRAAGDDEDDGAEKDAREKVVDGKQYKVDYFSVMSELSSQWETTNHQSLGELWLRLLMYYAVDFKIQEHAVSIRHKRPLLRKSRQWGDVRLAVEDPLVFHSNLGRGSTSNLVYSYLMGSLRLTALYFNVYSDPSSSTTLGCSTDSQTVRSHVKRDDKSPASISWNDTDCGGSGSSGGHEKTEVVRGEREGLGGSIEHQDSSIVSVSSAVLVDSTRCQEDVHSPVDLSFLSKQPSEASGQQAARDLHPSREAGCMHEVTPQMMPSDKACPMECVEDEFDGLAITAEGQISKREADKEESTQISSSPKVLSSNEASTTAFQERDNEPSNSRKTLVFTREEFVFQEYPLSCLNCKKLKHSILECPEFDLASKYKEMLPDEYPSSFYLKCISSCFAENMRMELPDEADILMRQEILKSILADITGLYPCATLEMFGSSANGFGSKSSDLDICLTIPDHDKESRAEIIDRIAQDIKKKRQKYEQVFPITSARVPIVKCVMGNWNMQCDISLENKLALRNTKLLAAYTMIDIRVPELGCALKRLAKACDVCDAASGSLSSYAYILMLLHYLQNVTPPVIPVLQQLKPPGVKTEGHVIDGWDCYYYGFTSIEDLKQVWPSYHTNTSTTAELWLGMLRYYTTEFNWNFNVVTIKQREPLSKFDKWWMGKPMCIEDPFNLDHNLGGGISNRMRMYILDRFMDALNYHCRDRKWNNIRQLMDPEELKGETRPPKFMRCHTCGNRGHKASECPKKDQLEPQQGSQQMTRNKEQRTKTNPRDRVVYNVPTPKRREKTPPGGVHKPNPVMPQTYTNSSLIPNNPLFPPPHPLLLPTSAAVHQHSPVSRQGPFLYPQYPSGFPNFNASHGILQAPRGTPPPALSLPYGRSNSYPSPYPHMVVRPRYVMPHTAGRSPPYRQYDQQPSALFQHPPVGTPTLIGQDPHAIRQSIPTHYTQSNPGLPSQHLSAPPVYSTDTHDSARKAQKGRRHHQKTQQKK